MASYRSTLEKEVTHTADGELMPWQIMQDVIDHNAFIDKHMTEKPPIVWKRLGWYLTAINNGYISGKWANPEPHGWKPPRVENGSICPEPHHS